MVILFVFGLLALNLAISSWNAYAVGKAWVETKHNGGWPRFMAWMGALMSGLGFTWCYLIMLVFILTATGKLTEEEVEVALNLGYLVVIPGFLFSGVVIMLDSWANAYRKRTLANVGVAGWNTFANIHNYYNAVKTIPEALEAVLDFFKGGSSKSKSQALIILLVIFALLAGFITTGIIISRVAASDEPLPN